MNAPITRRVWVTGASDGLGLALAERLLEQGAQVTASGRPSEQLQALAGQHGPRLLVQDYDLSDPAQAAAAARQIKDHWGALDCLIINAGTCDYLAPDTPAPALFEAIVSSNINASANCLASALALLKQGSTPQVMAVLSRYSALQIHEPSQPARPDNSLTALFANQRAALGAQAIDLTVVAPQSLKVPVVPVQAIPEQWTAQSAAEVILKHLPDRAPDLVLEALGVNSLWPLPR